MNDQKQPDPIRELLTIMERLRGADGCPWDREQTLESLKPFLVEETYEVLEAIEGGDPQEHLEELGDLLFTLVNVARWCDIAPEEGLAGTNRRFLDRFSRVEAALEGKLQGRSIKELEGLWQEAKAAIRAEAR